LSNHGIDTYTFTNNDEREVEKFVGIECFATHSIEGIGGEYKTNFKDFIVKEIDESGKILHIKEDNKNPVFSDELKDKYTTFNLVKINKDTFEAIRQISRILRISYIFYSGLKDKNSISVQKVSVKGNYIEQLKNLQLKDIFIRNITPTKKPVKLGSHFGNNFTVVIRNIEDRPTLKDIIEKYIKYLNTFGFPNYFGLQRFGSFRPNSHIVGRYLLEGNHERVFKEFVLTTFSTESDDSKKIRKECINQNNLEKAYENFPKNLYYEKNMLKYLIDNPGDYEGCIETIPSDLKNLLISSFQSYLFNKMLSLRIQKGFSLFKPINGDVISILDDYNGFITQIKYTFGNYYDIYLKKAMELNRASIVIPLIGLNTKLDEFPLMGKIYREIIELENIDDRKFKNYSINENEFKGAIRPIIVKPIGLKLIEIADDDFNSGKKKIKLEFSLQKGSYATMLIRELIK